MDDLTRLLLLELGYDAGNARKAKEEDGADITDGKGLALIDGNVRVEGKYVFHRNKLLLKPKTYEDGVITGSFLFSPNNAVYMQEHVKENSFGLGWLEFTPESSYAHLEFFYGNDNEDNFVSLKLQTSPEIPWLYLPCLDLKNRINQPFLEAIAGASLLQDINYLYTPNKEEGFRECWYKGTSRGADIAVGDDGGESYLLVFNKTGKHKSEQKKALEGAAENNANITVDMTEAFPPALFDVRVPKQVMTHGVVVEVRKGSGFHIPAYLDEAVRRLS